MIQISKKAAFLDRDGVINKDLSYVFKKKDFVFNKDILKLLKILLDNNFLIFIVTNQSGIARGLFSERDYLKLTKYYRNILEKEGINISGVYCCPHHPDFSNPPFNKCACRKPDNGMFLEIQRKYEIDMRESLAIGDSLRDLEPAYKCGIKKRILISNKNAKSKYITHRFSSVTETYEYFFNLKRNILTP